jgi:hypothetical protein
MAVQEAPDPEPRNAGIGSPDRLGECRGCWPPGAGLWIKRRVAGAAGQFRGVMDGGYLPVPLDQPHSIALAEGMVTHLADGEFPAGMVGCAGRASRARVRRVKAAPYRGVELPPGRRGVWRRRLIAGAGPARANGTDGTTLVRCLHCLLEPSDRG